MPKVKSKKNCLKYICFLIKPLDLNYAIKRIVGSSFVA